MEEGNIENATKTAKAFSEQSVRNGFIKKVYSILSVQLLITFSIVMIFSFVEPVKKFIATHPYIYWVAFGLSIAILLVLCCGGNIRRKTPYNFIFLFLFTLCEGVLIGCIAARYDAQELYIALLATIAVCVALTIFAFQTKIDFTMLSGSLLVLLVVLMVFGIFAIIFRNKILTILFYCFGALVFSLYLVFDTQLILGGKHKVSISPEEYIFATLNLYLDIVNLFVMLLGIIGFIKN